ncbi:MAG TPA: DUF2203 domain-containing protein [Elusimicrobiota bacterium]|nr:DUF2203 domain-containing protein [Elusimicrobiota bacterium]
MKYFSVAEAEGLIPELEKIFEAVAELAAQAEMKSASLRRRQESGESDPAAAAIERSQLQFLAQGINERLQAIVELGALPKGIEPALVDFPHRLEGRDVYLCWRLGDKRLTHYHGMDEGFAARQPLPRRRA